MRGVDLNHLIILMNIRRHKMGGGDYRHISSNPKDRAWASALDICDKQIEQAKSFKDKQRAKDKLYEEFENIFGKDKQNKR